MTVRVQKLPSGQRDGLGPFLALPARVYAGDPQYIPPPEPTLLKELFRAPFADTQQVLTADLDGQPAARAVTRIAPGSHLGMIGFFESINHPDVACALLRDAVTRLRAQGATHVIGPIDGDTWHPYRVNTGPFDSPPFLMEPYNPTYYPALWETAGFLPREQYYSKRVDDPLALADRLEKISRRVAENGYTFRPLDRSRFRAELEVIHRISCEIFADNFLYTDIPLEDFVALYAGARSVIDPGLIWFGSAPGGEPVGFVFAIPDYMAAVAAMRGKRTVPARLRFLLGRRGITTLNVKTIGVIHTHRPSGLGAALLHRVYRAALAKGYHTMNHCLIKDGNPSGNMDRGLGRIFRRYALYEASP